MMRRAARVDVSDDICRETEYHRCKAEAEHSSIVLCLFAVLLELSSQKRLLAKSLVEEALAGPHLGVQGRSSSDWILE